MSSFFTTHYAGSVEQIGSGILTSGFMGRRSFVKIGPQRIRNVMSSNYLDSLLEAAVDSESDAAVSIGWMMFYRWLLAVRQEGDQAREGIFLFAAGMLTHVVVVGLASLIAAAVAGSLSEGLGVTVGIAGAAFLLATLVLNVRAWLVPPPRGTSSFPV